MKIALIVSVLLVAAAKQDPPTRSFTEPYLGLQFNYPASWTIVKAAAPPPTADGHSDDSTPRKGRRKPRADKTRTVFSIPIEGTLEKAELQVVRTEYHASIDLWQTIQLRESEIDHTQVVRQWEQDVLGVPMLFSRVDIPNQSSPASAILGLFYTRTSYKLLFRLTAPSNYLDKVTFQFNKMLETLRQTDGKLPQEDDPSIDLEPITKKTPKAPVTPHVISALSSGPKVPYKAPVVTEVTVSTRKVLFRIPEGWSAENVKGDSLDIRTSAISVPIHIQLFTSLDSDAPAAALLKQSSADLDEFKSVTSREDIAAKINQAACSTSAVWRVGTDAKGTCVIGDLLGSMGDYYFLGTYRQSSTVAYKVERKAIELFMKQVGIEPAP